MHSSQRRSYTRGADVVVAYPRIGLAWLELLPLNYTNDILTVEMRILILHFVKSHTFHFNLPVV